MHLHCYPSFGVDSSVVKLAVWGRRRYRLFIRDSRPAPPPLSREVEKYLLFKEPSDTVVLVVERTVVLVILVLLGVLVELVVQLAVPLLVMRVVLVVVRLGYY